MSPESQTLKLEQAVKASPAQVYHAFTNATALREWFSDVATVNPHPGGHLFLSWNAGFSAMGVYTRLEPDREVGFTWYGRGYSHPTQVQVRLSAQDGGALVSLEHSEIGSGEAWAETVKEIRSGWKDSLENLASVLESGEDLRFVRRPMLGILVGEFNPEIAKRLRVPVTEGIRLDSVVTGMGSEAAGLQKDDVIVSMAGQPVTDWPSLTSALQTQHGGDTIEVVFYRGGEKKTVMMELSRRPIPEIPKTAQALSEAVRDRYNEVEAELERFFEGVSEAQASHKPAPGEWSAKENLAHLIHGERGLHTWIANLVGGQEPWYDDFGGNIDAQAAATLAAYPTLEALQEELKRSNTETVAFLASLPAEFVQSRKGSYWRLAYNMLEPPYHFHEHIDQMRAAIQSAGES